ARGEAQDRRFSVRGGSPAAGLDLRCQRTSTSESSMLGWSTSSRSAFAAVLHGMLTIFVGVAFLGCGKNSDAGARAGAVESGTGLPPAASGVMGASPVGSHDAGGFAGAASPRPSELPAGNDAERLAPAEPAGDDV